jgi:ELWxxDGT repeat protein
MFAADVTSGLELWTSDGTQGGTRLVRDVCPGTCDGIDPFSMEHAAVIADTLFFLANDGAQGLELWKSDGTTPGTVLVRDIRAGPSGSDAEGLVDLGGILYFVANDGSSGRELWRSDGTTPGTYRVADIRPGPGSGFGRYYGALRPAAGRLYFAAHNLQTGLEPWQSDGTEAGTAMVGDVAPGPSSSIAARFARAGERLFFAANDGATGEELWALDVGPTASVGDALVREGDAGTAPAEFRVIVEGSLALPATVDYGVTNGTATSGSDFLAVAGVLTFLPGGPSSQTIAVPVVGDQADEADESFHVQLSGAVGVGIDRARGDGVILDEDGVRVSAADVEIAEGDAGSAPLTFTATLATEDGAASTQPVAVAFMTREASATAGVDFSAAAGVITFPAGSPAGDTRNVDVSVSGDVVDEGHEAFTLELQPLGDASVRSARGTIRDDDGTSSAPMQGVQHGSVVFADLAPVSGSGPTADTDWYLMGSLPDASYEIVADGVSGGAGQLQLDRIDEDDVTVLGQGVAVGTGKARSLRWITGPTGVADRIRVRSGDCGTSCTSADVYRLRVYETTYSIPRFNAVDGLSTVVIVQNRTGAPVQGEVKFWLQYAQTQVTVPLSLPPRGSQIVTAPPSVGGVTIVHDGGYGALAGKAATFDPLAGASYDAAMEPRRR